MDENASDGNDNFNWSSDEELETCDASRTSRAGWMSSGPEAIRSSGEWSSSGGSSASKVIQHFVRMGFPEKMVVKTIKENASILDSLLTDSALQHSPREEHDGVREPCLGPENNFADDFSDEDSCLETEELDNLLLRKDNSFSLLVDMGYSMEEALTAIDKCGLDAEITELMDYICAAQTEKEMGFQQRESCDGNALFSYNHPRPRKNYTRTGEKRNLPDNETWNGKRVETKQVKSEDMLYIPKPMVGFGVPDEPGTVVERRLPQAATGPPYFYYENVALTPKGVWQTISRFLYDIEPEFVDSKFFCTAARKRGYIHNLPIHNRYPLLPRPPLTIQEAFPLTKKWWPSWDSRTKLNCLLTCVGSAKLTERIRKAVEKHSEKPPPKVQKYVLEQCRKWNLVWVGRNKVAPLEPHELEMLLGFPRNHTRGGGISQTDRYKALGNSFQVDTVAYHLSVLKERFPYGINVLSLFSGIGGAEVALHRLGIPLKNVVSVEISEVNRNIVRSWWEKTNQQGTLIEIADVQKVTGKELEQWISFFGGFDLVIGGSPCNNLAGGNRVSRDGLQGEHSSLFYQYCRILDLVRCLMAKGC